MELLLYNYDNSQEIHDEKKLIQLFKKFDAVQYVENNHNWGIAELNNSIFRIVKVDLSEGDCERLVSIGLKVGGQGDQDPVNLREFYIDLNDNLINTVFPDLIKWWHDDTRQQKIFDLTQFDLSTVIKQRPPYFGNKK